MRTFLRGQKGADPPLASQNVPSAREPTVEIVRRIKGGDRRARDVLIQRYLPLLKRWAHGRLPSSARSLSETDDLVQITLLRALNNITELRLAHAGSFFLYLKNALLNSVRDEIRRQRRQGTSLDVDREALNDAPASQDILDDYSELDAYERALQRLPRRQQQLLVMRLEFGLSYDEIAVECNSSNDAVRMMVTRAVAQLAKTIERA